MQVSGRAFCLTLNNPVSREGSHFGIFVFDIHSFHNLSYFVYQLELSTTGTRHVQAYLEFKNSVRVSTIVNYFVELGFNAPHVEPRRGSADQARQYCMVDVYDGKPKGLFLLR